MASNTSTTTIDNKSPVLECTVQTSCKQIVVYVLPTTGGQIDLHVSQDISVENLKKLIAGRLKVPKDKIVLLLKNRQLTEGTLLENHVTDGAKITLLPSVETGLLAQRPEHSVRQALEGLTDVQVDNFLAGRAPLNLTMRLGDHMMFIQLQLSTAASAGNRPSQNSNVQARSTCLPTPPLTPTSPGSSASPLSFPLPQYSTSSISHNSVPLSPPPSPGSDDKNEARLDSLSEIARSQNYKPALDTKALVEASRNLTQTLRQLSTAALGKRKEEKCEGHCCKTRQSGAVIESMYHHGRGVYSGTFSGTLSPALQDSNGRPRRDIGTIIHILNDLLGASSGCCQCMNGHSQSTHNWSMSCAKSSSVNNMEVDCQREDENKVTRGKVEQLQLMLEERRQRRKARREVKCSPYYSNRVGGHSEHYSLHPKQTEYENSRKSIASTRIQSTEVNGTVESSSELAKLSSEAAVA
ncbi:midnolin [Centruroides vittatus]|uniref:midnolin n=1 Tax=Centruroides vittatus TaxID=120091 RepID=UPI00350FB0F3